MSEMIAYDMGACALVQFEQLTVQQRIDKYMLNQPLIAFELICSIGAQSNYFKNLGDLGDKNEKLDTIIQDTKYN